MEDVTDRKNSLNQENDPHYIQLPPEINRIQSLPSHPFPNQDYKMRTSDSFATPKMFLKLISKFFTTIGW